MKRSKKILASLLCAAMLCIPTLPPANRMPPAQEPMSPIPSIPLSVAPSPAGQRQPAVQKPGETKPTDGVVFWTENTMIPDAVSGDPVDADAIKTGETVYAWLGAPECYDHEPAASNHAGSSAGKCPGRLQSAASMM